MLSGRHARRIDLVLPDLVLNAYYLLGVDWLETAEQWKKAGFPTPPVMITVANRTETAARIRYSFERGKIHIDELCAPDSILHIDSRVLSQVEALDDTFVLGVFSPVRQDWDSPATHD